MEAVVKCLKILYRVAARVNDPFFERVLLDVADSLIGVAAVSSSGFTVEKKRELNVRIEYTLKILSIAQYIGEIDFKDSLLLERDILTLKSRLLSGEVIAKRSEDRQGKDVDLSTGKEKKEEKLNMTSMQMDILELLKGGRKVSSKEIVNCLGVTSRSIRRSVGPLVEERRIKRVVQGRDLYYIADIE